MKTNWHTILATVAAGLALCISGSKAPCQIESSTSTNSNGQSTFPGERLINSDPPFLTAVEVDRNDGVYREGDRMTVRFRAERKAYLYLLYHQADGKSFLLFPNLARSDNLIEARRNVNIPSAEDGFKFRTRPPFGTEVLQVLAATTPIAELNDLLDKDQTTPTVSANVLSAVANTLRSDKRLWAEHRLLIRTMKADAPNRPRVAKRVGLFVGIGEYQEPRLAATHQQLRHSAKVVHELMLKRGQLDPKRTRLLTDKLATKAGIEESIFRWLPNVSEPGDTVFIYFSGHAGQSDNLDGSEADGKDEALAPYDLTAGSDEMTVEQRKAAHRQSLILDDTLARWLQQLHGRQIVLILDTCHSGGVVQGKSLSQFFEDESTRVKDISQLNTVVLTSCGADEQALFENTPDNTMWFTYFLAQAIKSNQPLTVKQAHAFCLAGMREVLRKLRESRVQEPTLTDNALLPILIVP